MFSTSSIFITYILVYCIGLRVQHVTHKQNTPFPDHARMLAHSCARRRAHAHNARRLCVTVYKHNAYTILGLHAYNLCRAGVYKIILYRQLDRH